MFQCSILKTNVSIDCLFPYSSIHVYFPLRYRSGNADIIPNIFVKIDLNLWINVVGASETDMNWHFNQTRNELTGCELRQVSF